MNGDRVRGMVYALITVAERSARFEATGAVAYEFQASHAPGNPGECPGVHAELTIHRNAARAPWVARLEVHMADADFCQARQHPTIAGSLDEVQGAFNAWARSTFARNGGKKGKE